MNDSHVSQTTLKNVLNQTPYLLFYERVLEKKSEAAARIGSIPRKISAEISHSGLNRSVSNSNLSAAKAVAANFSKNVLVSNNITKVSFNDSLGKAESFQLHNSQGLDNRIAQNAVGSVIEKKNKQELNSEERDKNIINNNPTGIDKRIEGDNYSFALKKEKNIEKTNVKININLENQMNINKFDEKSKNAVLYLSTENNKSEITNNKIDKNILIMPQKSSEEYFRKNVDSNTNNNLNNKKSVSNLSGENEDKQKQDNTKCMGLNEIKKALLPNQVNTQNQTTNLFDNVKDGENSKNNKTKAKNEEAQAVNLNLIKSKTSFELKVDLCDEIDNKETSEIKKNFIDLGYLNSMSTRSSNKTRVLSRKFKRLMSIFAKFGTTSTQANNSFLDLSNFNSQGEINENAKAFYFEQNLELNESPSRSTSNRKKDSKKIDLVYNYNTSKNSISHSISNIENDKVIQNISNRENNKNNQHNTQDIINNKNNKNQTDLESDTPVKKRIFNTKINEIYHGRFIERWEDEQDDENELNKLRSQADFVRKSDAFKKNRLLRKSKYDMDYDAGKQKKVRILDEKDNKGKNVFQLKHSNMLRKIKNGADQNRLIANEALNFEMKRKDRKFKNRDSNERDRKFGNDRDRKFNNFRNATFGYDRNRKINNFRNEKFNKFNNNNNKFNKFSGNKNGRRRFDNNNYERRGENFRSFGKINN